MNTKSAQMYKEINFFNFFIALTGTTAIYFLNEEYAVFFLLGLILADITLLFNLISINFILYKVKNKSGSNTFFCFGLRVSIVSLIGLIVFNYYGFSIIAFILGYSAQSISIVLYGINTKECEGK